MEESGGLNFGTVLSCHLPGGTGENHKNLRQENRSPARDLNPGPDKHKDCQAFYSVGFNLRIRLCSPEGPKLL
jgi:hypothetical protein